MRVRPSFFFFFFFFFEALTPPLASQRLGVAKALRLKNLCFDSVMK
jgi:hypothetical protein